MAFNELGRQFYLFVSMTLKRSQLDDSERKLIPDLHEPWIQGRGYGNDEYVKYGKCANGITQLYISTRNVPAGAGPPDEMTSPQNWRLLA